jgi:hypothetical protein
MRHAWGKDKYILEFDGKPLRKEPLGRPKRRWENNIKCNSKNKKTGLIWSRTGTIGGLL